MDGAIATVKNALRDRRDALVAALERELPEARFTPPSGGYFMWVELPEGTNVAELENAAREREVVFVKGTDFLLDGEVVARLDAARDLHGRLGKAPLPARSRTSTTPRRARGRCPVSRG